MYTIRSPASALPGDGGGRGDGEVLHLEERLHGVRVELNALPVGQAQRAVVVQHGVHVLDPDG
eukprot:6748047-Pyramimonas_sp.AAC.1